MNENSNRATLSTTNVEPNTGDESVATKEFTGFNTLVNITVTSYRYRNHDPDGICFKAVLDGIVRRGILADDSTKEVKKISYESIIIQRDQKEKTLITIEEVKK